MAKFLTLSHLKIFFKSLKEKLSPVAFSGNYEDIIDTPELADVATSGDYNDLKNKPKAGGITPEEVEQLMQDDLADVAFSGDFYDLQNTPTIPTPGDRVTVGKKEFYTINSTSTAEGSGGTALGDWSHSEGYYTYAMNDYAHAEGFNSQALGKYTHAENKGYAMGDCSHAEGLQANGAQSYTLTKINDTTFSASGTGINVEIGDFLICLNQTYAKRIFIGGFITSKTVENNNTNLTLNLIYNTGLATFTSGSFKLYNYGAFSQYSHVEGQNCKASGESSHAEGYYAKANGSYSHAEGYYTKAEGEGSHAEGNATKATAKNTHAEGSSSQATFTEAHAEGWATRAAGRASHAEGKDTVVTAHFAHGEGESTQAVGQAAHAEGYRSISIGDDSHSEGQGTATFTFVAKYSTGDNFIITTYPTVKEIKANQLISITKNSTTYYGYIYEYDSSTDTISVDFRTALSSLTENESFPFTVYESGAYGNYSHAEGNGNTAIGEGAHAEGHNNKAVGIYSHVEGQGSRASGAYSHAEGETTAATGTHSHAEGSGSTASGQYSHAEGYSSKALAYASHAEGLSSKADGYYAHAEGENTIANHRAQHVFGKYNIEDPTEGLPLEIGTYVEIVGNGEQNARSNARTLDWNGNEVLAGTLTTSSSGITIGNTTITETQLQQLLALLNS